MATHSIAFASSLLSDAWRPHIISGKPDHTKSAKFIADLLQICQAWLPLFWSLIPALMEIQQHDDKVTPIKSLLFEEMKADTVYGAELGTIVETQASQLWLVVARGNVESMPALSMGTSEASLFSEIKTGGNGDEVRKSNVEHKNIVSLVLYIQHYHEKNLLSDRRMRVNTYHITHTSVGRRSAIIATFPIVFASLPVNVCIDSGSQRVRGNRYY